MKAAELFEAIKTSFFDVLGFLLPGLYALLLLDSTFDVRFKGNGNLDFEPVLVILVVAYISGYVIYSISEIIERHFFQERKTDDRKNIQQSISYRISSMLLSKRFGEYLKAGEQFSDFDFRTIRSIVMSFSPKTDNKVYTFRFRGELCRSIGVYSFLHFILVLAGIVLKQASWVDTVEYSTSFCILLVLLPLIGYTLSQGYFRFSKIADSIPFPIFIATYKEKAINEQENSDEQS